MSNRCIAFLLVIFIAIGAIVAIVSSFALQPFEVRRESSKRMQVGSGSMVPTFVGQHFVVNCEDCKITFQCDGQASSNTFVCPNCGFRHESPNSELVNGQQVKVDLAAYENEPPQRWDTIAFRQPGEDLAWAVKRVIGLPGENIAIKNGELYADNRILQKPIPLAMSMGVLVHDSQYPAKTAKRRWRPAGEESDWKLDGDAFKIDVGQGSTMEDFEKLERTRSNGNELQYHNWRCVESPAPRDEDAPIRDSYGYNHAVSRTLNDARDIYMLADMEMNDDAKLIIFVSNLVDFATLTLDTKQTQANVRGINNLSIERSSQLINGNRMSVAFGLLDQRVFVVVNGNVVIDHLYQPRSKDRKVRLHPPYHIRLWMGRGSIALHRLRVYRDIHYLGTNGDSREWQREKPVAANSYFVLGDNVPISRDSRDSSYGLIPSKNVLGKTIR